MLRLPVETLQHMVRFVEPRDTYCLMFACQYLRSALYNKHVWKHHVMRLIYQSYDVTKVQAEQKKIRIPNWNKKEYMCYCRNRYNAEIVNLKIRICTHLEFPETYKEREIQTSRCSTIHNALGYRHDPKCIITMYKGKYILAVPDHRAGIFLRCEYIIMVYDDDYRDAHSLYEKLGYDIKADIEIYLRLIKDCAYGSIHVKHPDACYVYYLTNYLTNYIENNFYNRSLDVLRRSKYNEVIWQPRFYY
jgi:hypothetical protein